MKYYIESISHLEGPDINIQCERASCKGRVRIDFTLTGELAEEFTAKLEKLIDETL